MEEVAFGRYRLRDLLGKGGMGRVYRAYDTATDRIVAVKVLPDELAGDTTFQQRFRREAHAAAALTEPHVVPIHSFGEIEGRLYVDMRLIEGINLDAVLREGRPIEPLRAVTIVEQVASALDAAHKVGLVHRDVKPSNILLTERDFVYLIDFGIARGTTEQGMTQVGQMVGTWAYMAPERFATGKDTGKVDPRSDVYALACVLYECLTCSRPYPGDSLAQQMTGHLTGSPPRPSQRRNVSPEFDAVVAKGMAKDPAQRYQTALELAAAARQVLTAHSMPRPPMPLPPGPVTPQPPGPATPWPPTPRPGPTTPWPPTPVPTGPATPWPPTPRPGGPTTPWPPTPRPPGQPTPPPTPRPEERPWWRGKAAAIAAVLVVLVGGTVVGVVATSGGSESGSGPPPPPEPDTATDACVRRLAGARRRRYQLLDGHHRHGHQRRSPASAVR